MPRNRAAVSPVASIRDTASAGASALLSAHAPEAPPVATRMNATEPEAAYRILIVDDSPAIHDDFRKILAATTASAALPPDEALLFGESTLPPAPVLRLELDSAFQGEEALELVRRALAEGRPYAMAFIDVRMPPGWDGIETTARIWAADPDLQVVICTAYSDYSRDEMLQKLGLSDRLLILKKPFDNIEALQLATALTEKWQLSRQVRRHVHQLEEIVSRRTEQLRRSEDRYRLITENAGDLIAVVDPTGRWLYRSPSFERLLGYTADELAERPAFEIVHPDDRAAASAVFRDCLQHGLKLTSEFRMQHKEGTWLTMDSHASPFRTRAGMIEGTLFVTRDITERRKLEMQLRQSQKLESIGQLAAGIAHEINTPMQFIGDNTRFLEQTFGDLYPLLKAYDALLVAAETGTVTPEILAAARTAHHAAGPDYLCTEIPKAIKDTLDGVARTTKIVRAMKTFSHPGAGEKRSVDLREAIESTLTISRSEWRHVAEVVTEFDADLPAVPLLAAEFNQVLLNLIVNATHAIADAIGDARQSKGTIAVSARRDGDWAEIRVRDTGTGIPEKVQLRIFEPFFTTKPVGQGTGQGLTIARSVIVDQHGGTLHFETAPGQGTTFIIRVPLHAPDEPAIDAA
jgi:PAS domain S-box-containing protein